MVPPTGVEPARYYYQRILSPLRMPIPPRRQKQSTKRMRLFLCCKAVVHPTYAVLKFLADSALPTHTHVCLHTCWHLLTLCTLRTGGSGFTPATSVLKTDILLIKLHPYIGREYRLTLSVIGDSRFIESAANGLTTLPERIGSDVPRPTIDCFYTKRRMPSVNIFFAAFISRSWRVPHCGQTHLRTDKSFVPSLRQPQMEHIWLEA